MSVTGVNLANLTAYPLSAQGASVDNDNIQKLRAFSTAYVRRSFSFGYIDYSYNAPLGRATKRTFASVQIP